MKITNFPDDSLWKYENKIAPIGKQNENKNYFARKVERTWTVSTNTALAHSIIIFSEGWEKCQSNEWEVLFNRSDTEKLRTHERIWLVH